MPLDYDGTLVEKSIVTQEQEGRIEIYGGLTATLFAGYVMRDELYFETPGANGLEMQFENMGFVRFAVEQILVGKRQTKHFGFYAFGDANASGDIITNREAMGFELFMRFPGAKDEIKVRGGGEQITKEAANLEFTEKNYWGGIEYTLKF
jgi:hypothetical protein